MNLSCCILLVALVSPGSALQDRWLGEDKLKHFFASFVVTSVSASGARAAGVDAGLSVALGAGLGAGAGLAKEIHDATSGGFFSYRDLLWDLAGVGAGVAVLGETR